MADGTLRLRCPDALGFARRGMTRIAADDRIWRSEERLDFVTVGEGAGIGVGRILRHGQIEPRP
jgi:hypothetical protein